MGLSDSVTDETDLCDYSVYKGWSKLELRHPTNPTFKDNMKAAILVVALFVASAHASRFEDSQMDQSEARFIFFNSASSATSLTLLGAVLLLGVVGFLVYSGGLLG